MDEHAIERADSPPEIEIVELARALRAQLERLADAGADGLPRADPAQRASNRESAPAADSRSRVATPTAPTGTATATASAPAVAASERVAVPVRPAGPTAAPRRSAPEPAPAVPSAALAAAPPSTDNVERARRLHVLSEEVKRCTRCALHEARTQTVFARGDGSSGLCFVGEGPGADEDAQGYPFVGAAGQLLDRMIGAMGFLRDEVYVCNIVKCRPPKNRKPEPDEMAACVPYLSEQLEIVAPKVIVALGATAVEGLLGVSGGITRMRGTWRLYRGKVPVMPTFHPAYLLRTPAAKRQVWEDLQAVVKQMGRELPARR